MNPIRITAVSYYNTLPFIFGLTRSGLASGFELSLDVPSECARKIVSDEADIGLIPSGALPGIAEYRLVSNYCIGADNDVKSVLLLANSDLHNLKTIYLDTDSRTSVLLVQILAKKFWHINPTWKSLTELNGKIASDEGIVLIGDKTFGLSKQYDFCFDLAGEWIKFTGLPFVFAVWVSKKSLPVDFSRQFEEALEWGVNHFRESVLLARNLAISEKELIHYLEFDISFHLDEAKRKGLNLFLSYLKEEQAG
jgi:chorismate dehydratase